MNASILYTSSGVFTSMWMVLLHRDDPEFEGIRERAMQRIVSGEVDKATGRLVDWSKALALEMELSQKPQVII